MEFKLYETTPLKRQPAGGCEAYDPQFEVVLAGEGSIDNLERSTQIGISARQFLFERSNFIAIRFIVIMLLALITLLVLAVYSLRHSNRRVQPI